MKAFIFILFYIFISISYVLAKDIQIDSIVAIVNDEIILNSDVDQALLLLKTEGKKFKTPLRSDFLKDKIIQKLIIDSLILQEANRMHITITKEQINTVIENIALKKNISIDQLKNNILSHDLNNHIYNDNYVRKIEKLLKMRIIQDYELHQRINISEKEVSSIFKNLIKSNPKLRKINLSYILLPYTKKDSNNTRRNTKTIAQSIVNKLQNGYNFEDFLIDHKKNKSTFLFKKTFWMNDIDIKNSFSESINILKKDQILGPLSGNKGFYILKINDIIDNKENIVPELHLQHLLIKPSIILTDEESKNQIFNIHKRIKKGIYSFDYAVKNFSHDFYSSNKKGDLGWVSTKLFGINLDQELLYLQKNEISNPIKSNLGWHIFKLLDKRQVDQFYNFLKKQAYNILLDQKIITEKQNWIKDLQNTAYIKIIRS